MASAVGTGRAILPSAQTLTAGAPGAGRDIPEATTAMESCTSASYFFRLCAIAEFIKGCRQLCLKDISSKGVNLR